MEKISNASDLSAKLKQKREQDSDLNRSLVLREQEKLLIDLQGTHKLALDTTMRDIRDSLQSRLGDMAMLTAQEAQTVQKMVEEHQRKLSKVMISHYSKAIKAIRSQTDQAAQSLERLTDSMNKATAAAERSAKVSRRRWIFGVALGLTALLIICAGSWGLVQYLAGRVQQNLTTIDALNGTIQQLQSQTHGLQIYKAQNGTFLILPEQAEPGFTVGGRSAVRLQKN